MNQLFFSSLISTDSEIPQVMEYVEPPTHSVGEATANTTSRMGMFSLSLTSFKTDIRNQMSNRLG